MSQKKPAQRSNSLSKAKDFYSSLLLGKRLLPVLGLISLLFCSSFLVTAIFPFAQAALVVIAALALADIFMLFNPGISLRAIRKTAPVLSLGDDNPVRIQLENESPILLKAELIDELPEQLQIRDFSKQLEIQGEGIQEIEYVVHPVERGEYHFGDIRVVTRSFLDLFARRMTIAAKEMKEVYPSIMQMKELEIKAFSRTAHQDGIKKLRRRGVSYEFEQISPYVKGDDIRHINWKATGRTRELMVNRFETERSQPIYSVICKTREMRMPFHGLSLLDYAVNTTLALSNIALLKYDKMGLITFSDKIGSTLKADRKAGQLKQIMQALYNEKERETEANYDLFSRSLQEIAKNRSLLFLFTNFESEYAAERALPHLRMIAKKHLLVTIFFKNTEIEKFADGRAEDLRGVYTRTIARKMINEKQAIVRKLQRSNIQCILTEPERLSMATVNKYLELKSRGMI